MRTGRIVTLSATVVAVLGFGIATPVTVGAQTSSPTSAEVNRAKAGLAEFTDEYAPESESKPTELSSCPFGDDRMIDLAKAQDDYDASAGEPTVSATVFVDETVDKGTRAISCSADYTDADGESQTLNVAVYADPGLKTPAFAKALAKETKGKVVAMDPPSPKLAGGKAEGYCVKYTSSKQCAYVWSRNGLYVEIDNGAPQESNFTELRNLVLAAVDELPDAGVGVN